MIKILQWLLEKIINFFQGLLEKTIKFFQWLLTPKKVSKFTLYVGLNDKNTRKQEMDIETAKDIISKEFANNGIERSNISWSTRYLYLRNR